jgi:TRAP-type C4-dicarboxylate transport system permease small subunit
VQSQKDKTGVLDLIMTKAAQALALAGGLVLLALVAVICTSVLGRELVSFGFGPILGDFELVEAGVAFAVFAFLPLTQLQGAHASVDVFAQRFGARINALLATLWQAVMLAVMVLITWRLWAGMVDKRLYGETSFLIQFPLWWAYAACVLGAVLGCVISLYCLFRPWLNGNQP